MYALAGMPSFVPSTKFYLVNGESMVSRLNLIFQRIRYKCYKATTGASETVVRLDLSLAPGFERSF